MKQPLALVWYEKLLPGTQLVNRLQDLLYRVQTVPDGERLTEIAAEAKPILVIVDLGSDPAKTCGLIAHLRGHAPTSHLPVIAYGRELDPQLSAQAQAAGATLVVNESAILTHLPQLLDQALQVE